MPRPMTFAKVLAPLFALSLAACATVPDQRAAEPVIIGIVGLNDFHGNLEPITRPVKLGDGREAKAGGAAWLALRSMRCARSIGTRW